MFVPGNFGAESEKSAQALAEEENVKDVLALLPVLNDLFVMLDQSCAAHHLERVKSMSFVSFLPPSRLQSLSPFGNFIPQTERPW